jgi:hypothetical protein
VVDVHVAEDDAVDVGVFIAQRRDALVDTLSPAEEG